MYILIIILIILYVINNITTTNQFDKQIYIINLEKDKLRYNEFKKDIHKYSIHRFNAIDGRKLNIEKLKKDNVLDLDNKSFPYSKNSNKDTLNGSIACALSHITLWKKLLSHKDDYFIIFEDDSIVNDNIISSIDSYIEYLPKDWDILYLGGSRIYGKKINDHIIKGLRINDWMNCGLYAYVINKKSLNKIIKLAYPISTYIDMQINKYYGTEINAFYTYPSIVKHNYKYGSSRDINMSKYDNTFINNANRIVLI